MPILQLSDRQIDLDLHRVTRDGDILAELTPLESSLLAYLAARPGQAVDRDALLSEVWGYSNSVKSRAVDKTVNRLRTKIEVDPSEPRHLVGLRGHGYGLELPPTTVPPAPPAPPPARPGAETLVEGLDEALRPLGAMWVLVGPAGSGKSKIAAELLRRRPGARLIDVAGVRTREALLDALCDGLEVAWHASTDRRTLLLRALRATPGLILLDSCQDAAEAIQELLPPLSAHASWLLCSRTELPELGARQQHLFGLDTEAAIDLLAEGARQAGVTESLDREALREIAQRVGGHPRTLVVIAPRLAFQAPTQLARTVDAWLRGTAGVGEAWARVLGRAMEEQWAALSPSTRHILARCAVLDVDFSIRTVLALVGREEAEVIEAFEEGRAASVLVPKPGGRAALLAPMVPTARRALGEDPAPWRARAMEVTVAEAEAERAAMAAGAVGPARARLVETRRALSQLVEEIGPENPALAARAAVALWPVQLRRDPVRFVGLAEPLLRQELPPELRGRLLVCMAECQRVIGNMTGADRTLDEAERLLPTEAHAARAHLLITRCQLCFWKGTPVSEARAWLEAARAQLSLQADRRLELRMWLAHAQCQDREGNPLAARGYSAQAAEGARAIGDDELLAISLQFLAYCDRRDDPENTIRLCREAEALFLRSGDSLGALVSASATGSALWQLGQLEEARRVAERTGIRARALGDTLRAAQAQDLEAYIAFELELFDLARQRWAEAARLAAELGIRALEGSAALGLGVVAQAEGRLAEARAAFEAVATQPLQQDDRLWVLLVHALLQAEVGDQSSFSALVEPLELQLAGTTEAVRSTYRAVLAFARALLDRKAVAAAATVCAAQLREVGSGAGNLPRATRILVDRVAARCG